MVTLYYLMQLAKRKKQMYIDEQYNKICNEPVTKVQRNWLCRVCLKDGAVSIFGDQHKSDVMEALKVFANVEVSEDDTFPKHLCNICYKFIKSAIMFRKIATKSNDTLKKIHATDIVEDDTSNPFGINTNQLSSNNEKKFYLFKKQYKEEKERRDKKIQCPTCNKIIKKSSYRGHMTLHDPNHQNEICDICGKICRTKGNYVLHRQRHRTDYPYKCKCCPYKSKCVGGLKSHMHTHSNEFKYMCTECPARFRFIGNLNSHILVKHKDPQYKCDTCQKTFYTKLKLRRHHEIVHLGIKNHICNTCGRAFGDRYTMVKHERRVHKNDISRFKYKRTTTNNNT